MGWKNYKHEFISDGIPRNISIDQTRLNDWRSLIDYLVKTDASLAYFVNGVTEKLPEHINENYFSPDGLCMLSIYLDGVQVICPFLEINNITLTLDPKEIDNELKAKVIFRLMSTVGRTLDKTVTLYADISLKRPVFIYRPGTGLEYHKQDYGGSDED